MTVYPDGRWYLPKKDDREDLVRPYWRAIRCPSCDCSTKRLAKVMKVSYLGADNVKDYVLEHLMQDPGKHKMPHWEAKKLCFENGAAICSGALSLLAKQARLSQLSLLAKQARLSQLALVTLFERSS